MAVISAVKRGDWNAAGNAVLGLPTKGGTFGVKNVPRATAIRTGLQTPHEDPCA